jgi:hypothetical protein
VNTVRTSAPRQRRETLTDAKVADLPRRAKRYVKVDPEQRGMYVRVMPSGAPVFAAVARDLYGKQVWATIGSADVLKIDEAREKAREAVGRIRQGKPVFEPPPVKPASYQATAEKWLDVYVAEKGLRSRPEIERLLRNFVFPFWGRRHFVSIKRRDINELLDNIVKTSGAWKLCRELRAYDARSGAEPVLSKVNKTIAQIFNHAEKLASCVDTLSPNWARPPAQFSRSPEDEFHSLDHVSSKACSLNTERTARKTYRTRDHAKADVFEYIERFYNAKRRHSTIGYRSPMEFVMQAGLA